MFIDEAGFNLHMRRLYDWSQRGKKSKKDSTGGTEGDDDRTEHRQQPITKVPKSRGVNLSVLGAICWDGVPNLSLRTLPVSKKRPRITGKRNRPLEPEESRGTNSDHFAAFLNSLMDTLDKLDKKGMYLVMDNAPIHKTEYIHALVKGRGYVPVFLPPYSPFLNPIEEFWSQMKRIFRRQQLEKNETNETRLRDAGEGVEIKAVRAYIMNAYNQYFLRVKSMEPM